MLIKRVALQAERLGYVETPHGRRIPIPRALSYKALNFLIQSFCADLLRLASVRIRELVKRLNLPVKFLLSVHDETNMSLPEAECARVIPLLKAEMLKCEFADLPVEADVEVGYNWAELTKWDEWQKKAA